MSDDNGAASASSAGAVTLTADDGFISLADETAAAADDEVDAAPWMTEAQQILSLAGDEVNPLVALHNEILSFCDLVQPTEREVAQRCFQEGSAMHSRDQLEDAVRCYREAAKQDETRPEILYNLGNALQDLGRLDEAADTYTRVIRLQTDHHAAWYNLGYIMEETHQLEEAIKCFSEAARLAPNDQDALVNRGNCYMQIGDIENAIHSYEMVLQADESSVIAW